MDRSCTADEYDALYARWLTNPGKLLDAVEWEPGQVILDLCGGTGAVARECIWRGAAPSTVHLFDQNPRCMDDRITIFQGDAEKLDETFGPLANGLYDVIVIRQAAGYLSFSPKMLRGLHRMLKPNGKLVFNTFVRPRWAFKTYRHGGRRFFEASAYFGRTVFHLQASPGLGYDVTRFHWHPAHNLHLRLYGGFFEVVLHEKGKTQTWICTRGNE